jgi:hypothetical protein
MNWGDLWTGVAAGWASAIVLGSWLKVRRETGESRRFMEQAPLPLPKPTITQEEKDAIGKDALRRMGFNPDHLHQLKPIGVRHEILTDPNGRIAPGEYTIVLLRCTCAAVGCEHLRGTWSLDEINGLTPSDIAKAMAEGDPQRKGAA